MNATNAMLLTLSFVSMFSTQAMAEDAPTPPVLEVSEKFWPPSSNQHLIYAMNFMNPVMPERRWIPYADGIQISEIKFHEIAGLDQEVERLKTRKKRAWTGIAGGAAALLSSIALLSMHTLSEDETQQLGPVGIAGTAVMGVGGMTAYFLGVHGVWFQGTKRQQAYKIAEEHNRQR